MASVVFRFGKEIFSLKWDQTCLPADKAIGVSSSSRADTMTVATDNRAVFAVGDVVSFDYPKSNRLNNRRPTYRRWTICVTGVRDVAKSRLSTESFTRRPLLRRGRWLITGICLETCRERSFYLEAMRGRETKTWFTLGLFDPCEESAEPVYALGTYAPTVQDREFLAKVIAKYDSLVESASTWFSLGVFPVSDSTINW